MIHKSYSTVVPGTKNYQYYCYNKRAAILQQIIKTTVKCPTGGERLNRQYTKFDFAVDEGKEWLNPSREKN